MLKAKRSHHTARYPYFILLIVQIKFRRVEAMSLAMAIFSAAETLS